MAKSVLWLTILMKIYGALVTVLSALFALFHLILTAILRVVTNIISRGTDFPRN